MLRLGDDFHCDTPSGQTPFDPVSYMGIWYEQMHVTGEPFQPDSWTCNTAQYSYLDPSTGNFNVANTGESANQRFDQRFGVSGTAKCPTENVAECYVTFFGAPYKDYPNYVVLETDYENYSVIYTCEEAAQFPYLWLMARQPIAEAVYMEHMYYVATQNLIYFDYNEMVFDEQGSQCK